METRKILTEKNLKCTPARTAILSYLAKNHTPFSAEQIQKATGGTWDTSTLYRTLKEFIQKSLVKEVHIEHGKVYFEIAHTGKHHHHIVCRSCKKIEELHLCVLESLLPEITKKSILFSEIDDHTLEFFGTCKQCSIA